MAIRVKVENSGELADIQSKLGALGMEIVFDEEENKTQEPKDKKDKDKKKN